MASPEKIPLSEAFPLFTWRRQAKVQLAPPTGSFQGKTVLFVGATGTILSEAARMLADLDVTTLIFGVRSVDKGEVLANELRQRHGDQLSVKVLEIDLLSFASVHAFVAAIKNVKRIDVVVNGSAIINSETRMTDDGWEECLQLIHLSSALLILRLLPKLLADGEERPVVLCSIASLAIYTTSTMVKLPPRPEDSYIEQLNHVESPSFQKNVQYGLAKILHASWIRALCSRLPASRVHCHQLDPGSCASPLSAGIKAAQVLLWFIGRPLEMSARTMVNACQPIDGSHGKLLVNYDVIPYPGYMDRAIGIELQQRAWNETRRILMSQAPETESIFETLETKPSV